MTKVKICGITDEQALEAAISHGSSRGADFIGLVFHEPSPRNLTIERAAELAQKIPDSVTTVGLFVDPDDGRLEQVLSQVKLDMIQLHGSETPARLEEIKSRFSLSIMKAIRIGSELDLASVGDYEEVSDWMLFDTKSDLPGGSGQSFDWMILKDYEPKRPWMLAGGLDAQNVQQALSILNPTAVDVSSGVENDPGQKAPEKIAEFIETVKNHDQGK